VGTCCLWRRYWVMAAYSCLLSTRICCLAVDVISLFASNSLHSNGYARYSINPPVQLLLPILVQIFCSNNLNLSWGWQTNLTLVQNKRQNYTYLNLHVPTWQMRSQTILNWTVKNIPWINPFFISSWIQFWLVTDIPNINKLKLMM
jgi:hypothetical protein